MIKDTLYVSDLDGTLLNSNDKINDFSLKAINKLIDEGMKFTYATARSLVSASIVTKGLSLHIPVIIYNGVAIALADTGKILYFMGFSNEEQEYMVRLLTKMKLYPFVYTYRGDEEKVLWYPSKENEGMRRYLSLRQGDKRFQQIADNDTIFQGNMFYYTCIGEKEELQELYDIVSKDKRYRCTLQQELYRQEYWCEIMPARASKAAAIEELKKIWECSKIVSFGDAVNDIPMFQISDEAYAVENAVPELKKCATAVIESNNQDGVAHWLIKNA